MDQRKPNPLHPVDPTQPVVQGVKAAAKRALVQGLFAVVFGLTFVTIAAVPAKLIYRWALWLWSLIP